ncbi:MAG: hypothetical protein ACJ76B_02595 [Solirubrobacterales bacterium]
MRAPLPVAAAIAQRPGYAGHAWAFLHFALGFRALGYEPILIDRLSGEASREKAEVDWFRGVTASAGLDGRSALLGDGDVTLGISRGRLRKLIAEAPFVLNIMGFLDDLELREAARMLVFLDVDPGFTQIWQDRGEADLLGGHDRFVTVGMNIGSPGCSIPACGRSWIGIRPPVVLSRWPTSPPSSNAFRSVATWRGPYDPIWDGDKKLGLRVHEFRKFIDLPRQVDAPFELALDIEAADEGDARLLRERDWSLLKPKDVVGTLSAYADFIRGSGAEISIAKNIYVDTKSGWFSDRSACFLASGRPVLAQDTGWSDELRSDGLLPFSTAEEAVDAAEEMQRDLAARSEAARLLAEETFDSKVVLGGLLAELDAG